MTRTLKLGGQVLAVVGIAGLLTLLIWRVTHQQHSPKVGATAPGFTLSRLTGSGAIDLASFRGRPVVLNFWASWCGPCKSEARILEQAWQSYRPQGVTFIGVDYHDVIGDARRFVSAHRLTFPMVEDGSGNVTSGRYGVTQVPETFVVGRNGKIVLHLAGPITTPPFSAELRRALAAVARS